MTKPKELKVGDRVLVKATHDRAKVVGFTERGTPIVRWVEYDVLLRNQLRKLPARKEGP